MCLTIHERHVPGGESVFLHIKRPAVERELDLSGLEPLDNLQIDSLVYFLKEPDVRRTDLIAHYKCSATSR